MKIAYLVHCHLDPRHVARLSLKLTRDDPDCAVFIHVDGKASMAAALTALVAGHDRIHLSDRRIAVYWGGFSQIEATYALLHTARRHGDHDRFMILQGADYPIKSARQIQDALAAHPAKDIIRACDCTIARTRYLYGKSRYVMFFDRLTTLKRIANKATRLLDLRFKRGSIMVDGGRWHVFWGSAQICFSRATANLFLSYEDHPALTRYFRHSFVTEELFFHTIAFNAGPRGDLVDEAPIPERDGIRLVDTRAICYFEYPDRITVFGEADFERLRDVPYFFIRKVTTDASGALMDRIDAMHADYPRLA